jgi:hypothetical protein
MIRLPTRVGASNILRHASSAEMSTALIQKESKKKREVGLRNNPYLDLDLPDPLLFFTMA